VTTRSTGANANNQNAAHDDEQARRPRRRKAAPAEPAASQPPEQAPPATSGRGTRTSTPRTRASRAAPETARKRARSVEPEPVLPEEVVDEAAPLHERVPLPAQEPEPVVAASEVEPATPEPAEAEPKAEEEQEHVDAREAAPGDTMEDEHAGTRAVRTRGRRGRERGTGTRGNALGALIEQRFADPSSPVRSYSELERRSAISREALSRYVTPRADRRRSPTIDTLAAISDALHLSLEQVCRAAVASARGVSLPPESEQRARDEVVAPLVAPLTDDQFSAVVELLRQMQRR
jgi:transcriptional regulator with XRE-family HTH domain